MCTMKYISIMSLNMRYPALDLIIFFILLSMQLQSISYSLIYFDYCINFEDQQQMKPFRVTKSWNEGDHK